MQFDWWTFAFQLINVTVLIWLLGRFMFRPIAAIIAQRQEETRQTLAAAEAKQQQATAAEAAALVEKDRIAAERLALMQAARDAADAQRKTILDKARAEAKAAAQAIRADARRDAEEDRQAREQRAVDLAIVIAQRLLDNLPGDGRIAGYPQRLRTALAELAPAQRQAIAADLGQLRFRAARQLDATELDQATGALNAAFPGAPAPPVEVDQDLIAGLELQGRHCVVHNSRRHDLTLISKALVQDAEI